MPSGVTEAKESFKRHEGDISLSIGAYSYCYSIIYPKQSNKGD